jgi:hypothetical protein
MLTTAQLKLELTEKMDKAIAKGGNKARNVPLKTKNRQSYPAGVKYHMYAEVTRDL